MVILPKIKPKHPPLDLALDWASGAIPQKLESHLDFLKPVTLIKNLLEEQKIDILCMQEIDLHGSVNVKEIKFRISV